jgi:hypothetical protein
LKGGAGEVGIGVGESDLNVHQIGMTIFKAGLKIQVMGVGGIGGCTLIAIKVKRFQGWHMRRLEAKISNELCDMMKKHNCITRQTDVILDLGTGAMTALVHMCHALKCQSVGVKYDANPTHIHFLKHKNTHCATR